MPDRDISEVENIKLFSGINQLYAHSGGQRLAVFVNPK